MSFEAVSWALKESGHFGTDLLVLISLAERANESGEAWPSHKDLAKRSRVSERQIRRSMKKLIESGEVEQIHRYSPGRPTRYRMTWMPCPRRSRSCKGAAKRTAAADMNSGHQRPVSPDSGVHNDRTASASINKEPSTNHQTEPSGHKGKSRPRNYDEWKNYAMSKGLPEEEAEASYDYYESCGWVIGRSRKPVKDWQACVRTWKKNYRGNGVKKSAESSSRKESAWSIQQRIQAAKNCASDIKEDGMKFNLKTREYEWRPGKEEEYRMMRKKIKDLEFQLATAQ